LHVAAAEGNVKSAKLLLRRGAVQYLAMEVYDSLDDYRERKRYRQGTPEGLARQRGHGQLAEIITRWNYGGWKAAPPRPARLRGILT
jgi:hypothetical protein